MGNYHAKSDIYYISLIYSGQQNNNIEAFATPNNLLKTPNVTDLHFSFESRSISCGTKLGGS